MTDEYKGDSFIFILLHTCQRMNKSQVLASDGSWTKKKKIGEGIQQRIIYIHIFVHQ